MEYFLPQAARECCQPCLQDSSAGMPVPCQALCNTIAWQPFASLTVQQILRAGPFRLYMGRQHWFQLDNCSDAVTGHDSLIHHTRVYREATRHNVRGATLLWHKQPQCSIVRRAPLPLGFCCINHRCSSIKQLHFRLPLPGLSACELLQLASLC